MGGVFFTKRHYFSDEGLMGALRITVNAFMDYLTPLPFMMNLTHNQTKHNPTGMHS